MQTCSPSASSSCHSPSPHALNRITTLSPSFCYALDFLLALDFLPALERVPSTPYSFCFFGLDTHETV
eukprot:m.490377 g.490377  ORF g.490377 m.490377 type:complete len:68 (-) comp57253_c0_seq3:48-251(-)